MLLTAALLKGYQLATEPVAEASLFTSRWFLVSVVEFELFFGLWLVSGFYPRPTRVAAMLCFLGFAGVSLYQAVAGEASCGCFGKVPVSPWYTLAFDLAAVAALTWWQPAEVPAPRLRTHRLRFAGVVGVCLLVGVPGAAAMLSFTPAVVTAEGDIIGDSHTVLLQPETWVGEQFPLLSHTDLGEDLAQGDWVVLLYHHNCSVCRELIPRLDQQAREAAAGRAGGVRVALLEVPPYGDAADRVVSAVSPCKQGRLSAARDWFVKTPVMVKLQDGTAVAVTGAPKNQQADPLSAVVHARAGSRRPPLTFLTSRRMPEPTDFREQRRNRFLSEIACGPLSLIVLLEKFGMALSDADRKELIATAGTKGTDLLQLKELAEHHGLQALGVQATPDKLRQIGLPAIALLHEVGFVAVTDYAPGKFHVTVPLKQTGWVSAAEFRRAFGRAGRALLLSRETLNLAQLALAPSAGAGAPYPGPRLRPARFVLAVGRILGHQWQEELILHNDGDEVLHIKAVEPSCTCMTAAVEDMFVKPQQSTTLRVKGTQAQIGSFTYHILLLTNQKRLPAVKVPVRGYLEYPVFPEKAVLAFDDILPDRSAAGTVELALAEGVDIESVQPAIPKDAPVTAAVRQTANGSPELFVQWRGTPQPGRYEYQLKLNCKNVPGHMPVFVKLTAHVVPRVEAFPASLFIADEDLKTTWIRHLALRVREGSKEDITWTWSGPECADFFSLTKCQTADGGLKLTLSPTPAGTKRGLSGKQFDLLVSSSSGTGCKIPVYLGAGAFTQGNREVSVPQP